MEERASSLPVATMSGCCECCRIRCLRREAKKEDRERRFPEKCQPAYNRKRRTIQRNYEAAEHRFVEIMWK
jgi:hypothetical protein